MQDLQLFLAQTEINAYNSLVCLFHISTEELNFVKLMEITPNFREMNTSSWGRQLC